MDNIFHGRFALPQVLTYRSSPQRLGRLGCKQQPRFKCIPLVTAKNGNPRVHVYVYACTCVRVRVRACVILGSVSCKNKEQSQKREYHAQFSVLLAVPSAATGVYLYHTVSYIDVVAPKVYSTEKE